MKWCRESGGSAALVTIVMLPLLLIVLAGVVELGALRLAAMRAANAADLATTIAVNDQDDAELARTGSLIPAADAEDVARSYFALNLDATSGLIATSAGEVAASADIAVYRRVPATDERTGARYDTPTVRILARVPVRTPAFAALLLPSITTIVVHSASSAR